MVYAEDINIAYINLTRDGRINVWHISIYIALLHLWGKNKFKNPVPITRKLVMQLAHINSIATYHKCVKQLEEFGYIHYAPNYNAFFGSAVTISIPENKYGLDFSIHILRPKNRSD